MFYQLQCGGQCALNVSQVPQNGHHCNNYTKLELMYSNHLDPRELITLSSFLKNSSYTINVLFPRYSDHFVLMRVFNDAGNASLSNRCTVSGKSSKPSSDEDRSKTKGRGKNIKGKHIISRNILLYNAYTHY